MTVLRRMGTVLTAALATVLVASCGEGTTTGTASGADPTAGCDGNCTNAQSFLTVADVEQVIAQGVQEALARNVNATIGVVDRVGNVLGVYRMGDRRDRVVLIASRFSDADGIIDNTQDATFAVQGGLEGIKLPDPPQFGNGGALADLNLDHLASIAKAITGAYLSTEGMAFTSRTANQIVQEHFNPGEDFQPGGPLFGVQFSQLGCSDFTPMKADADIDNTSPGPHPSPLGLAADPGGLPLYKDGALVGGVGVMADGVYGLDTFVGDIDQNLDELIAIASTFGYGAPLDRRDRVTVEGKVFRYSDADFDNLITNPRQAPALATQTANGVGSIIAVRGFTNAEIRQGTVFGTVASGIVPDSELASISDEDFDFDPSLDAFVFVNADGSRRHAVRAGSDEAQLTGDPLSETEVGAILSNALDVANRSRAQIRRPLGTPARVTISVVDSRGEILGMVRGRDAPSFGADVSLQKARTSAFFSSPTAADFFRNPVLDPLDPTIPEQTDAYPPVIYVGPGSSPGLPGLTETPPLSAYVDAVEQFLGDPNALTGGFAFSDRAGGNLSRPFFPDGINNTFPGPFSKPAGEWSVFSTGLQLDASYNAILSGVVNTAVTTADGITPDSPNFTEGGTREPLMGCVGRALNVLGRPPLQEVVPSERTRLANGFQIFPGSVPIYRGNEMIGAVGVSGDGVDQDDMISFLGVHNAALQLNGSINNAPARIRADQLTPQGVRLRYIQCPQSPFINTSPPYINPLASFVGTSTTEDNVCDGL